MLYKHYFIESLEQPHEAGVVAPFYRVKSSDCKVPALNHYIPLHNKTPAEKATITSVFTESHT